MADVLWTMDSDGAVIELDACIFTDTPDKLDRIKDQHQGQGGMNCRITGWQVGTFKECWMKLGVEPLQDADGSVLVHGAARNPVRCTVHIPRAERGWWATPVRPVMVPIWEAIPEKSS
jgi:hypothetical protein